MLLQHIWVDCRSFFPQLQEYQELIEKIKLTPRIWNPAVKLHDILKYLSWMLNISVNLIGFKRTQAHHSNTFKCSHTQSCFLPYYKYQNPFIRFSRDYSCKNPLQINILEVKSEYFTISSESCHPLLINQVSNFNFYHNSQPVTLQDINDILKKNPMEKTFSIILYSTSSYVRSNHSKVISKHIVGHLPNNSEDILHLFLSPHLHGSTFDVYKLDFSSNNNITLNNKNLYHNTHITEGIYDFKTNLRANKEMLNQEHCICEHPDTERFHAPNNKSFRALGKLSYRILHKNNASFSKIFTSFCLFII